MEVRIGQVWVDTFDGEAVKILKRRKDYWEVEIIRNLNHEARDDSNRFVNFGFGFENGDVWSEWKLDETSSVQEILNKYEER